MIGGKRKGRKKLGKWAMGNSKGGLRSRGMRWVRSKGGSEGKAAQKMHKLSLQCPYFCDSTELSLVNFMCGRGSISEAHFKDSIFPYYANHALTHFSLHQTENYYWFVKNACRYVTFFFLLPT
ncbi:unnamed protein product [Orchesella dallaii]|uniref:Uncharacterized protein n=1 Tax=Orchesella dallaii TaxID=48710 RepID=A0ABP1RCH5_9HEXA